MSTVAPPPADPDVPVLRRALDLRALAGKKSHFLFGPRQTGKSFLVRHTLGDARLYDLLDASVYQGLSRNPGLLAEQATSRTQVVVIDEIQRLPELLNEVHRLIESRRVRFVLTGSSARKLRRRGVNLLVGRALTCHLHCPDQTRLLYKKEASDWHTLKELTRG